MSTMQVETLDLLTAKGRFDPQTARAIGEAISLETRRSTDSLATKQDLVELRAHSKSDVAELRTEMKVELQSVKAELVRWIFLTMMGQSAMLLGGMYFLLQHTAR
jgi:hypothetical protein